jgi:predicted phage tail protein
MKKMDNIIGAGGGDSGGSSTTSAPTEAPDSIRSTQYGQVLDLISEGEISGLVNGLQSVYLDDVPVQNADGSANFSGVTVETRNGTLNQDYIAGFDKAESEKGVLVQVTTAAPVVRSITNNSVTHARITIGIPSLFEQNDNGDIIGTSLTFAIDLQNNGGGYVTQVTQTISDKTTTRYQRDFIIALPSPGNWDIRLRRITADSTSAKKRNDLFFDSYTEIVNKKFTYPHSALVGLSFTADQFQRVPTRGYDIKGILCQIPDNYDPIARTYTDVWGGSFQTAWTDNPAWVFYDMVTNNRYGLGQFVSASQIDKWELYTIAQYCDESVDDGFGGTEPRFTCNIYIQSQEEAIRVLAMLASIFRGIVYWSAGTILTGQDAPADPISIFNESNVIDGLFTYEGSSLLARKTVALVTWNDPDDSYKQKIEYVADNDGITLYGIRETQVIAVGCTSRGQAHRAGKWALFSGRLETETVTFRTGLQGTEIYPGAIFEIQDQSRAGTRFGGRIASATTTVINLDADVTLNATDTYTLSVIHSDGSIETKEITNSNETTSSLTLSEALSDTPQVDAIWALRSSSLALTQWRAVAITEIDELNIDITAVRHFSGKYDLIENDVAFEELPTSNLKSDIDSPTNIVVTESLYIAGSGLVANLATVSWSPVKQAARYRAAYYVDSENVQYIDNLQSPSFDIENVKTGVLTVIITAFNSLGTASVPATITQTLVGDTADPGTPQNLTIQSAGGLAILRWTLTEEPDVRVGGDVVFRHSPADVGADWSTATTIGESVPGNSTAAILPLLSGTYLAKFKDAGGRYSVAAATVATNDATALAFTNLNSLNEHPTFSGTHSDTITIDDVLKLNGSSSIDSWGNVDDVVSWDAEGGVEATGTYVFSTNIDRGSVQRVRIQKVLSAQIVDVQDMFDARTENIDTWLSFDGVAGNEADAVMYVRTTDDDPAGTPTWSAWQVLDSAEFNARAFEFKLELSTNYPTHNIHVSQLGVTVDEVT